MCRYSVLLGLTVYLFALGLPVQAVDFQRAENSRQVINPDREQISPAPGNSQIAFTKNMGQWPDSILFRASVRGATLWLTRDGIYYQYLRRVQKDSTPDPKEISTSMDGTELSGRLHSGRDSIETTLLKAEFVGASKAAEVIALEPLERTSSYYLGSDPAKWYSDVPNYSVIVLKDLYPGVDVTFRGSGGHLQYEQKAVSQAALDQVQVEYRGGEAVVRQSDGTALVQTRFGEKAFAGAVPVAPSSTIQSGTATIASPQSGVSLVYSTYLGGGNSDIATGIAVDTAGSAYVTGWTYSADFPKLNTYDNTLGGIADVFVTKLTAGGNGLVYSTFIGGNSEDEAWGIAVDAAGNAYIAGQTRSADFPCQKPFDNALSGDWDAFATKLAANGKSLLYSTYVGGSDIDLAFGIAVDASGNASITGTTRSIDFPSLNAYDNALGGTIDGFVTKLGAAGNSLVFSTYLGGSGADSSFAITANGLGDVYVTGATNSYDFPVLNAFQTLAAEGSDVFVTKLSSGGVTLDYSTFLGGDGDDIGYAIAYAGSDSVCVTGRTNSTDFPTHAFTGQPYQSSLQGASDAFVAEISCPTGSSPHQTSLVYGSYLGGGLSDKGLGIAKRGSSIYITGLTYSNNFPTQLPYQTYQSAPDAFVTRIQPLTNSLAYSTYLGGNSIDWGQAIAVDAGGSTYVTGFSVSTNFPTQTPYQSDQGDYDAFVTKLSGGNSCCVGTRGNVNNAGIIDLADLSLLIAYLTRTPRPTLPCLDAANVNGSGIIDLGDLSLLIAYLTKTPRPTLPACP